MNIELSQLQKPLLFAHIGDLHITSAKERNYMDFLSILIQIEVECGGKIDFVYLPGDIADHGQKEQYRLVAAALRILSVPVHMVAGDHDMEQGSLDNFYTYLKTDHLPKAITIKGVRCIFLDVNGYGAGGPDFRLGSEQLLWLANELENNKTETIALFMHTYPDDLKDDVEKASLLTQIANHNIALVDMGHTHYNELSNDGTTIYAATRSTGQIEEGPVGYSLISIYDGIVSWRFKPLDSGFPFVLITSPADYRLIRKKEQTVSDITTVQAVVFGSHAITEVLCWTEEENPVTMTETDCQIWIGEIPIPHAPLVSLTIQAIDTTGRRGKHQIQVATPYHQPKNKRRNGSDADRISAWADNGIPGTQLGPNRNAKPIQ